MRAACAILIAAACGSSSSSSSPPPKAPAKPLRCDELRDPIEKVVAVELGEQPGGAKPLTDTQNEFAIQMIAACKGDAWSQETIACIARGKRTADWDACPITPDQLASLKRRLGDDDDPPTIPKAHDLEPDLGVAACDDYLRAIARALQCPSLDEPSREQLRDAVDHQKHDWRAMPADQASGSCKLAMDALNKAAKIADCTL